MESKVTPTTDIELEEIVIDDITDMVSKFKDITRSVEKFWELLNDRKAKKFIAESVVERTRKEVLVFKVAVLDYIDYKETTAEILISNAINKWCDDQIDAFDKYQSLPKDLLQCL